MKMRSTIMALLIWGASLGFYGCSKKNDPGTDAESTTTTTTVKDTAKTITQFTFAGLSPAVTGMISQSALTITTTVPSGTDLTKLVPTIVHSGKSRVSPDSGIPADFTSTVSYTVTPEEGSAKIYKVTVTATKSTAKDITSFVFNGLSPAVTATVDQTAKTIKAIFPPATDPTQLVPAIAISAKATVTPATGAVQDFSQALNYKVTAEDGTFQTYSFLPTLPVASVKDQPSPPKKLCIYYAWPSVVNGSNGNVSSAIAVFRNFDVVVFGDGIWKTTHGDHARTIQIITSLKSAGVKVYGYIDLGVHSPTQNLSETDQKSAIDGWQAMGVDGVFGDDFGSDYGVSRSRQNVFIDYAHGKSLTVFANSWSVTDALAGSDCHLGKGDYYLLESFLVGQGSYRSLDEFKQRGDLAYYYMKTTGVSIAAVATIASPNSTSASTNPYLMAWYGTTMYDFDAFQFTDIYHSSISNVVNVYAPPLTSYGTKWKQTDWIEKVSPTMYRRSTDTYTLIISGDGATAGTGSNTKP